MAIIVIISFLLHFLIFFILLSLHQNLWFMRIVLWINATGIHCMPCYCNAIELMKWIESHTGHASVHFSLSLKPLTECPVNYWTVALVFHMVPVTYRHRRRHCLDDGIVWAILHCHSMNSTRPIHCDPNNHCCHRSIWLNLISNFRPDDSLVWWCISSAWLPSDSLSSSSSSWSSFWVAVFSVWTMADDRFAALVLFGPCRYCNRMSQLWVNWQTQPSVALSRKHLE